MYEKVNPAHPDKIADRIAGAVVDRAYTLSQHPRVAVEVMIGHGHCHVIVESDTLDDRHVFTIEKIVERIAGKQECDVKIYKQDAILNRNQQDGYRCGDNGIFKGVPLTLEEKELSYIARCIYREHPHDGKYILDGNRLTICQSNTAHTFDEYGDHYELVVNPLGYWTGGTSVDTGATNRKLGSDMAQSVTGGGLHGKDLSKADVSINIYAFLKAQETGRVVEHSCSIGDTHIDGKPYCEIVEVARKFINTIGGFEKFAEWGLF
jgi:S-adenosylmethionine synthetase